MITIYNSKFEIKRDLIRRVVARGKLTEKSAIIFLNKKQDFLLGQSIFEYAVQSQNNYNIIKSLL